MTNGICVIVGAGPGMGLGTARKFGKQGYKVALIARRQDALDSYGEELGQVGIEAKGFAANIGDFTSLKAAFDQIKAEWGDPQVLIYNAAFMKAGNPSELSIEDLQEAFHICVSGALFSAQQVIPAMKANKKGTILFTGGGLALNPYPFYTSLAIGKAGIRSLAFSLGAELEAENIQVATVTISGIVQPGTHFDPDLIAESYWLLHSQQSGQRQREIVYK